MQKIQTKDRQKTQQEVSLFTAVKTQEEYQQEIKEQSQLDVKQAVKVEEEVFSVTIISDLIKGKLSEFKDISIKGEISGLKTAPSGHIYFNLKEGNNILNAICWRGIASKLPIKLEDGLEVVVTGDITTYSNKSNYQIIASNIRASGVGALMAMLEERRKKLQSEGYFDQQHKKPIPQFPQSIALITSPTGSVIRDMLHRIEERYGIPVFLYPVPVQGQGSAAKIVRAVQFINSEDYLQLCNGQKADVIIIARGGGSVEDLWEFNDEELVKAIFASEIPIISAVGHETDFTLCDYAADKRAPTPTAAAEIATPVKADLYNFLYNSKIRLNNNIHTKIDNLRNILNGHARGLTSPKQYINHKTQLLDNYRERLDDRIKASLAHSASNLALKKSRIISPTQYIEHHQQKLLNLQEKLHKNILYNIREKEISLSKFKFDTTDIQRKIKQMSERLEMYKNLLESYNYKNVLKRGYSLLKDTSGNLIANKSQSISVSEFEVTFYDGKANAVFIEKNNDKNTKKQKKSSSTSMTNNVKNTKHQISFFD